MRTHKNKKERHRENEKEREEKRKEEYKMLPIFSAKNKIFEHKIFLVYISRQKLFLS